MPDGNLDGKTRRELVNLLVEIFPSRDDLALLTRHHLNTPLNNICGEGIPTLHLVSHIIDWCERQGGNTLEELLEGAITERPQRKDLYIMAGRLFAEWARSDP